jgi:hypothetical protein
MWLYPAAALLAGVASEAFLGAARPLIRERSYWVVGMRIEMLHKNPPDTH